MVIDAFYFFNELDLLEIRLNILDAHVDKFILIEFSTTYSGIPKESQYLKNKERYAKWNHKINHFIIDEQSASNDFKVMAILNSNVGNGESYWVREFCLKESAMKCLIGLDDDSVVYISDLDEIWNPETMVYKRLPDYIIVRPKQIGYYYYLNNRCSEENGWTGTIVANYRTIKDKCLNDLRTRSKTPFMEIENGGWHFGFIGGKEGAKKKLVASNHPEYNEWIKSIEYCVENNLDYRGRDFTYWIDEESLPQYLKDNKDKWIKLFR